MSGGSLDGTLAVVTGGGSGIGRGTCRIFAEQGAKVVVADINLDTANETVAGLAGTDHCGVQVDVGDRNSVELLYAAIENRYSRAANVIINCAGITIVSTLLNHSDEDFEAQIHVNLKGTFLMTQEGCKRMIQAGVKDGSIVNISSVAAARVYDKTSLYSATKGAVECFSRVAALEMAPHGIRVNVISPGSIDTPMSREFFRDSPEQLEPYMKTIPQGRYGEPNEIGEVCAFLASSKSSYMTGSVVQVTGGRHM